MTSTLVYNARQSITKLAGLGQGSQTSALIQNVRNLTIAVVSYDSEIIKTVLHQS